MAHGTHEIDHEYQATLTKEQAEALAYFLEDTLGLFATAYEWEDDENGRKPTGKWYVSVHPDSDEKWVGKWPQRAIESLGHVLLTEKQG